MIKSFKTFWKGYFILIAATLGGEYLWFYKKDKLKE